MTITRKIRVLYIDDEPNNLKAFTAGFRRNYIIFAANTVAEAMKVLSEEEIHIIIADQRMPQTTGVEFFKIIRNAYPDPIRMLITGYADIEDLIVAVNDGEIFRYIRKPWDEFELNTAMQTAYEMYLTRRDLKTKVLELQKTNDELNRFVYSTSHDLRGPLSSVLAILNLIKVEQSVEDPNGYMQLIESCMRKMDLYVQKIIEYYKSVRVAEEPEVIDFDVLLDDIIKTSRFQNTNIQFDVHVNANTVFKSDAFRVSVILNNLISNAIKYQRPEEPQPKVLVHVSVDETAAYISIEDNGTGILEDHLNSIFTMFFRGQYSVSGLGIGLYIVKEALHKIGGEISVSSKVGEGTRFDLVIPNKDEKAVEKQLELVVAVNDAND